MKNSITFLILLISGYTFCQSASLGNSHPGDYENSQTNKYNIYTWSHSETESSLRRNVARIYNNQNKSFKLNITIENSILMSYPSYIDYIPPYDGSTLSTFVKYIAFDWSNPPSETCIDGYAVFKFTPVTGALTNHIPTGEPPIIIRQAFKIGEARRWLKAINVYEDYTSIDQIEVTNSYIYKESTRGNTFYNYHHYNPTNIYSTLISKLISIYVPEEKPTEGLTISPSGSYIHDEIIGDVKTPVKIMPGAVLRAVSENYFLRSSNRILEGRGNEIEESNRVDLYPTLASEKITLESNKYTLYKILIYDINNTLIIQDDVNSTYKEINISKLPENWYIINLIFSDGVKEIYKIYKK